MKKIFLAIVIWLPLLSVASDRSAEELWQDATEAYVEGDFAKSVSLYNSIVEQGYESADLYFNMGNGYYKQDSLAKAIVYYMKAQKMDPSSERIAQNLEHAQAMTKNRIDALPEFFVVTWANSIRNMIGSNGWAVVAVLTFIMSLMAIMLYLLTSKVGLRKVGFTLAITLFVVFVISLNNSLGQRDNRSFSGDAVVVKSAVAVKGSPDRGGKELFILNEGAVVKVEDSVGDWREIVVASGNKGWVTEDAILGVD